MASKSFAPRPSDGNSTIGRPSPCTRTSRRAAPRVTIHRWGGGLVSVIPELEQSPRVGAADLDAVVLADWARVEPERRMVDILERPVGREHHPVAADLGDGVQQRRRMEVA